MFSLFNFLHFYTFENIWLDYLIFLVEAFIARLVYNLVVLVPILLMVAFYTLAERKVMAYIHRRKGPNDVGHFGILQAIADFLKLLLKEQVLPRKINVWLFIVAANYAFVIASLNYGVVVFDFNFPALFQFRHSLLFVFLISSLNVYGVILAGWASNSKYAYLGSIRSAAQMISYELNLGVVLLSVSYLVGSLSITDVVYTQEKVWFAWPLAPLLIIFFILSLAETNRAPFDLPESESELVAGYNVEYASALFALFFVAEYMNMLFMTYLTSVFFLGGWLNPLYFIIPGLGTSSSIFDILVVFFEKLIFSIMLIIKFTTNLNFFGIYFWLFNNNLFFEDFFFISYLVESSFNPVFKVISSNFVFILEEVAGFLFYYEYSNLGFLFLQDGHDAAIRFFVSGYLKFNKFFGLHEINNDFFEAVVDYYFFFTINTIDLFWFCLAFMLMALDLFRNLDIFYDLGSIYWFSSPYDVIELAGTKISVLHFFYFDFFDFCMSYLRRVVTFHGLNLFLFFYTNIFTFFEYFLTFIISRQPLTCVHEVDKILLYVKNPVEVVYIDVINGVEVYKPRRFLLYWQVPATRSNDTFADLGSFVSDTVFANFLRKNYLVIFDWGRYTHIFAGNVNIINFYYLLHYIFVEVLIGLFMAPLLFSFIGWFKFFIFSFEGFYVIYLYNSDVILFFYDLFNFSIINSSTMYIQSGLTALFAWVVFYLLKFIHLFLTLPFFSLDFLENLAYFTQLIYEDYYYNLKSKDGYYNLIFMQTPKSKRVGVFVGLDRKNLIGSAITLFESFVKFHVNELVWDFDRLISRNILPMFLNILDSVWFTWDIKWFFDYYFRATGLIDKRYFAEPNFDLFRVDLGNKSRMIKLDKVELFGHVFRLPEREPVVIKSGVSYYNFRAEPRFVMNLLSSLGNVPIVDYILKLSVLFNGSWDIESSHRFSSVMNFKEVMRNAEVKDGFIYVGDLNLVRFFNVYFFEQVEYFKLLTLKNLYSEHLRRLYQVLDSFTSKRNVLASRIKFNVGWVGFMPYFSNGVIPFFFFTVEHSWRPFPSGIFENVLHYTFFFVSFVFTYMHTLSTFFCVFTPGFYLWLFYKAAVFFLILFSLTFYVTLVVVYAVSLHILLPFVFFVVVYFIELIFYYLLSPYGVHWLLLKWFFFAWLFLTVRASFPRYRYDQLMATCWKIFLPVSFSYFIFLSSFLKIFSGLPFKATYLFNF